MSDGQALSPLSEAELISVIGNLLDNAIEATQRAPMPHEPVEVLIKLSARELIIEVADHGVGIAPAIREHMFERGVTTKTRGDHGIGLYLTESYITRAGAPLRSATMCHVAPFSRCLSPARKPTAVT